MSSDGRVHPGYAGFVCLILIATAFAGCGRPAVKSTASEIYWYPPHVVDDTFVQDLVVTFDDQDLLRNSPPISLTKGKSARINVSGKVDETPYSGLISKDLFIRLMPADTSDADWDIANRKNVWPQFFFMGMPAVDREFRVNAEPGEYDARVFLMIQGMYDDLPTFKLIAKAKVRIQPESKA